MLNFVFFEIKFVPKVNIIHHCEKITTVSNEDNFQSSTMDITKSASRKCLKMLKQWPKILVMRYIIIYYVCIIVQESSGNVNLIGGSYLYLFLLSVWYLVCWLYVSWWEVVAVKLEIYYKPKRNYTKHKFYEQTYYCIELN